jgi:hypothetical protein
MGDEHLSDAQAALLHQVEALKAAGLDGDYDHVKMLTARLHKLTESILAAQARGETWKAGEP